MIDLDLINRELKSALTDGDMDRAKKLSEYRKRLLKEDEASLTGFAAKGVASGASLPLDATQALYRASGMGQTFEKDSQGGLKAAERKPLPEVGARAIEGQMDRLSQYLTGEDIIPKRQPRTWAERAAQITGETIGTLPYAGFGLGAAATGVAGGRIAKGAASLLKSIRNHPFKTAGIEGVSIGAASGLGQAVADRTDDNPLAEGIAELAGGVLGPSALLSGKGVGKLGGLARKYSPTAFVAEKAAEVGGSLLGSPDGGRIRRGLHQAGEWGSRAQKARSVPRIERMIEDLSPEAREIVLRNIQGEGGDSIGDLSWMQRSGNQELIDLEASIVGAYRDDGSSIRARNPLEMLERNRQLMESKEALTQEMLRPTGAYEIPGEAGTGIVKDEITRRKRDFRGAVEGERAASRRDFESVGREARQRAELRADVALNRAEEKIAALSPAVRESKASEILAKEVQEAYKLEKIQEKEAWSFSRTTPPVDVGEVRKQLLRNIGSMADPLRRRVLGNRDIRAIFSNKKYPNMEIPINDLVQARSLIGDEVNSLINSRRVNEAMAFASVRDAILDGIESASMKYGDATYDLVRDALDKSKAIRDVYYRGNLRKFIGLDDGLITNQRDPRALLGEILGAGKLKGNIGFDQLKAAVGTPQAERAARDYVLGNFNQAAVRGGKINPTQADKFIRDNVDILDSYPEIITDIKSAIEMQENAGSMLSSANFQAKAEPAESVRDVQRLRSQAPTEWDVRQMDTRGPLVERYEKIGSQSKRAEKALSDRSRSGMAAFETAATDQEVASVLTTRRPYESAKRLRNMAAKDPRTKEALERATIDHLFRMSSDGEMSLAQAGGQPRRFRTINPEKLTKELMDNKSKMDAYQALLGKDEFSRLTKILNELRIVDKAMKASGKAVPIDDLQGQLYSIPARILGVGIGKRVAKATGTGSIQVPGMFSDAAAKLMKKVNFDTAQGILLEMVKDPTFFNDVMRGTARASIKDKKAAVQALNAWVAGPGRRFVEAIEYQEESE